MSESMVERLGDALIGEVARQTKSDLGNTGDDNCSDLAIGGLDSDGSVITLDRQALARAALSAIRVPTPAMLAAVGESLQRFDPETIVDYSVTASFWAKMVDAALKE